MVERFNRALNAALRSCLNGPNWVDELLWVLPGLRTTPKEDIHITAGEMVYAALLMVPGDSVCPSDDPVADAELLSDLRGGIVKRWLSPHNIITNFDSAFRFRQNFLLLF